MITRFKSIKPLSFWVFWKSWICLEYFCSLRKLLTLLADVFCNVKMRCSPKDDECRNPTNRWENVSFPLIPTSPVWPLRYLRGHPCTRVGIGRGPEGGEHLVTFPPPPSPIPKISNLSFFMCGGSSSSFLWCSRIYIIRLEAFGKVLEERFEYLIVHTLSFFRWQRPWGSLRRPRAQTDKTSALQPSTWASRLEFFASGIPSQNH